jgi:hypothetical protein
MKCKLQIMSMGGWADLKVSENDKDYKAEIFNTISEARSEGVELKKLGHKVRIVAPDSPQEFDLYT